jgi:hypothetical protein
MLSVVSLTYLYFNVGLCEIVHVASQNKSSIWVLSQQVFYSVLKDATNTVKIGF